MRCSQIPIIGLFVHPLSSFACFACAPGALEVRLREFGFCLLLCIRWVLFVTFRHMSTRSLFSIFMVFVHPFGPFSVSGRWRRTSFLDERIAQNGSCRLSVLCNSFVLVGACENCSELNGCTKPLTFDGPFANEGGFQKLGFSCSR